MPASFRRDPLMAKAKPISDGSTTSGITYLSREKKPVQQQLHPERGVRLCERNNSADVKVSGEGGERGASGARAEIPLQPMVQDHGEAAVSLQPWEVNGGAEIHLQLVEETHTGAGRCLKESVSLCEACAGAGSLQDLWREEPTLEHICWQDL
ncbi:hypothetical protein DUI87_13449 [Hirundo rustica rustica]|uniref:Uncharacterized protein n=1 Tax=Hirundo rustica rustica TaxID=333673 RepID=A0A3M0K8Y6_HIRRU|nr:hypothetical protein DUI87_13449 [Hirundo rustica rustica]